MIENCQYCSHYYRNTKGKINNCCLGKKDVNKSNFVCNEDLNPYSINKIDTQILIHELENRGLTIIKNN